MACTLNSWQVKTICPPGWSADEGGGMDVVSELGFEVGDATGVKKLKTGLATVAVTMGGENSPGVDAASVANRSGVGDDAELTSPHPRTKNSAAVIQMSLLLVMIQLN